MARKMVCNWGMSDKLGMVEYGEGQEQVFLARDISSPRNYSESTAQQIDAEVKRFIDESYAEATRLISENMDKLEAIAQALLEYETIDGSHIQEIMDHGRIINPPSKPTPPSMPNEPTAEKETKRRKEDDGELPGDLSPVPG